MNIEDTFESVCLKNKTLGNKKAENFCKIESVDLSIDKFFKNSSEDTISLHSEKS